MDFTKITCISERCKNNNVEMEGAGGQSGGRVTIAKVRCPVCELTLLIIPMSDKYEYQIKATTDEERKEEKIREACRQSELELAKTITRIKERGY